MKKFIIANLEKGQTTITPEQVIEISGGIPSTIENLQSVLEQGSEAVIDNDFSVEKTNFNGKIAITEEGVKIEGQAKGVKIDGQGGDVDISGNTKLNGNTFLESNLWFGSTTGNEVARIFKNPNNPSGFIIVSPGKSQIIIAGDEALEINGNIELNGDSLAVIEDSTFGLVLDEQNRIKRQLLPSGSGEVTDVSATESGIVNNTSLQELGGVDKLINGVRIGRGAGSKEGNTALGEDALNSITTGIYNTGTGIATLTSLTQGNSNSAFGGYALYSVTVGEFNNAFGTSALQNNIFGISNNAFGCNALKNNVGIPILESETKGHRSCAFGNGAMGQNTIGNGNAFGDNALGNQTTGLWNIGIGTQSGSGITTGNSNTIIAGTGFVAKGGGITTGSNNLIVAQNNGNTTGVTTGSGNTILGKVTGLSAGLNNSVHLLNGIGEYAFRMNEDKSIDLPNLTKALINSGSDKSPVTKEWVNPQTTRPLVNTNFTTSDIIDDVPQYGREVNLQNTSNIEITVKAGTFSTYFKGGAGTVKFVADTGRTLKLMDATDTINGIVGSYAKVKSFGTVDYIYINNYE